MALKRMTPKEVTVGNYRFNLLPLSAKNATRLFGDIAALVLPLVTTISVKTGAADTARALDSFEDVNFDADSLAKALGRLDGAHLWDLVDSLLLSCGNVSVYDDEEHRWIRLDQDTFDEIFCCNLAGEILLCVEVIKQNYSNFFTDISTLFGGLVRSALAKTRQNMATSMLAN